MEAGPESTAFFMSDKTMTAAFGGRSSIKSFPPLTRYGKRGSPRENWSKPTWKLKRMQHVLIYHSLISPTRTGEKLAVSLVLTKFKGEGDGAQHIRGEHQEEFASERRPGLRSEKKG